MDRKEVDVAVIGAGVAGLTAGIYLKRSNLSALVLDKGAPGGKLNNIHRIDNYPGLASINGPDLAYKIVDQATALEVPMDYGEVYSVSTLDDGRFLVKTDVGEIACLCLIVATGLINGSTGIEGEKKYVGKGVSYCAACDGNFFKGKDVLVYGYKDHAVEDAIYLSSLANQVYFVHPSPIESPEIHLDTLKSKSNVKIVEGKVKSVGGENHVEGAIVEKDGAMTEFSVSGVFPLVGEVSSSQFLQTLGVEQSNGFLHVNSDMETNVKGLYAAGDIVKKKLRQIVNAAGEGAVAATSAISYVHERKRASK